MISLCCPSRGRPKLAKRLVDTALTTADHDVEFLFYLNQDDETLEEYRDLLNEKYYSIGPNQSTCYSWNLLAEKAKYDIVCLLGDDVQIQTKSWDTLINFEFNKYDDKILMVVPNDDRNKLNLKEPTLWKDKPLGAAHFAVHKNWINTLGYFVPPFFWHFYVDTWTQKVSRKLNRCLYLPTVTFKAKKLLDATAQNVRSNLNILNREDYVWSKVRDRHLQADVSALKHFIDNFKS
jgi:glycosyltransferase involved in cell wall biosynthesis